MFALETERLRLVHPVESDRELYVALSTDSVVRRYLGGPTQPDVASERFDSVLSTAYVWVVRVLVTDQPIGMLWLAPHHDPSQTELSYEFLPDFHKHGYALEACRALTSYAFATLGLPYLVAETQVANEPSTRLLERLGFRRVDQFERFGTAQGLWKLDAPTTESQAT